MGQCLKSQQHGTFLFKQRAQHTGKSCHWQINLTSMLQVVSQWRPYDRRDHARSFYGTLITTSTDLAASLPCASWAHDATTAEIELRPRDIVIAATDGFFDAVHVFGPAGAEARRFIRTACLEEELDPGQLAEKLLLRAWKAVQARAPAWLLAPRSGHALSRLGACLLLAWCAHGLAALMSKVSCAHAVSCLAVCFVKSVTVW
jgi:hypothetical protein